MRNPLALSAILNHGYLSVVTLPDGPHRAGRRHCQRVIGMMMMETVGTALVAHFLTGGQRTLIPLLRHTANVLIQRLRHRESKPEMVYLSLAAQVQSA
jgi:hypothetical protein